MLDTPINPSSFPSLQDIQNTVALNSNPILRNLKITQGYSDLRRVARIRAVANALVDAFERNQQLLRYGKARKATIASGGAEFPEAALYARRLQDW
jgi:hypothetical protein